MIAKLPKRQDLHNRVRDSYYPLRLRKRLRSTNLLERSLGEVKRRTKVIGRFPGETSCLSLCWAVMDLVTAAGRGLALPDFEHQPLAPVRAASPSQSPADHPATDAPPA